MKKSLKGSGPPRREIVKSLLERKKSAENDKRLGLKSLPERGAAVNSSTADCSQTRVRLESYGVTFPDRRNFTSSTSFCLSPSTAEEEEEQLCMAKQLSLGSIPFDNGDNIIGDELLLHFGAKFQRLYHYIKNFCDLIGLEEWYFSLI